MKTGRILILTIILTIFGGFMSEPVAAKDFKAGKNRVEFTSGNERLLGDLYLPPNYKAGDKLAAIVVGGSWTSVKEQMAGLYAAKLTESGFATLAFDHRFWGESGGAPASA